MDQSGCSVGANMQSYAAMPLIASLHLIHFRITRLLFIPGRVRSNDQHGIQHGLC